MFYLHKCDICRFGIGRKPIVGKHVETIVVSRDSKESNLYWHLMTAALPWCNVNFVFEHLHFQLITILDDIVLADE